MIQLFMIQVAREVRSLTIDPEDPSLVGLTQGASVVRKNQRTRGILNTLRKVQLTSAGNAHGGDEAGSGENNLNPPDTLMAYN